MTLTKLFLPTKFNRINSILFECHLIFQKEIAVSKESMNKEKGLVQGRGKKKQQQKTQGKELPLEVP